MKIKRLGQVYLGLSAVHKVVSKRFKLKFLVSIVFYFLFLFVFVWFFSVSVLRLCLCLCLCFCFFFCFVPVVFSFSCGQLWVDSDLLDLIECWSIDVEGFDMPSINNFVSTKVDFFCKQIMKSIIIGKQITFFHRNSSIFYTRYKE